MKSATLLTLLLAFACSAYGADITVEGVDGKKYQPLARASQAATVLFFIQNDCPVANGFAPEMSRIAQAYEARGVRSYAVYVEWDLTLTAAAKHARDYAYRFPAVLDPQHELVRAAGATATPEAAVFCPKGELLYRGRIDDRVVKSGGHPGTPGKHDLRDALDAILAGTPVRERFTKAIGCYIPDRPETAARPQASSHQ